MKTSQTLQLRPTAAGSGCIIAAGLAGFGLASQDLEPFLMARYTGFCWLAAIAVSLLFDFRQGGLRNLLRLDIFGFLAYYFLVFFEFLFPQPTFELMAIQEDVAMAVRIVSAGLIGLALGRHLTPAAGRHLEKLTSLQLSPQQLLLVYFGSFCLAYLHMWLAVDFNPIDWFEQAMGPRFSQPWQRNKFGSFATLLNEFHLLAVVIPPLAGLILANRKRYHAAALVGVVLVLLINFFFTFLAGTRNVFAVHIAALLAGYFISQPRLVIWKLGLAAVIAAVVFTLAAGRMLEFRNMGFKRYIEERHYTKEAREYETAFFFEGEEESTYFVDANLFNISLLAAAFPHVYDYLGMDLVFVAVTKPVPRALWPGKPVDLKVGLEEAIGVSGMTISATFAGEAYVAGGLLGSLLCGILIGMFTSLWNRFGINLTAPYPLLLFASGFPPLIGSMRSVMFFTTALLPAVALVVCGLLLQRFRSAG